MSIPSDRLRSFVQRIERLEEERSGLAADIREVYAEAKGSGFDPKILRLVIKLRAKKPHEVEEEETLLDVYRRALGMLPDVPA